MKQAGGCLALYSFWGQTRTASHRFLRLVGHGVMESGGTQEPTLVTSGRTRQLRKKSWRHLGTIIAFGKLQTISQLSQYGGDRGRKGSEGGPEARYETNGICILDNMHFQKPGPSNH